MIANIACVVAVGAIDGADKRWCRRLKGGIVATTHEVLFSSAIAFATRMDRQLGIGPELSGLREADIEITRHGYRTALIVKYLLDALQEIPRNGYIIPARDHSAILSGARHHDVGKMGIPPGILHKTSRLDDVDFEIVKFHCQMGNVIANAAQKKRGGTDENLRLVAEIALHHHERWDGCGYPKGLARESIPLVARLVAIADTYDALTSARPYKAEMPHEAAMSFISDQEDKAFDPYLLDVFRKSIQHYRSAYPGSGKPPTLVLAPGIHPAW